MERPFVIFTVPFSGERSLVIKAKIVLLPAPFCPIIVIFAPRRTEKSTSLKRGFFSAYPNDTLLNLRIDSFLLVIFLNKEVMPTLTYQHIKRVNLYKEKN